MPSGRSIVVTAAALLLAAASVLAEDHFRDPTQPYTARPAHVSTAPSAFKVHAIIVSDERRVAIVNGRRVGIGDTVGGATVVDITKRELALEVGGERRTLRLRRGGAR